MLLPRKWALSLGLLAAIPTVSVAGPFDFAKKTEGQQQTASTAESASQVSNQQVANEIAKALGKQNLTHKDVAIEYKSGVATISGQIKDEAQRELVTRVMSRVSGVQTVENKLTLMQPSTVRPTSAVQQAAAEQQGAPSRQVQPVGFSRGSARSNQQVAGEIGEALVSAGLSGYDIEVRYKNGVASLIGNVEDPGQIALAQRACESVDGVGQVLNELKVKGRPVPPSQRPMPGQRQFPIQQTQGMAPQAAMTGYNPNMMPPQPPVQGMTPHPGHVAQMGHQVYNQPNIPNYAWPSYAQYDNYSAVTYPSQYDASAWPYIGPYYPYPQVPLGWRSSTLEWDDGSWNLTFDSRTDRWWWFLNPKNW